MNKYISSAVSVILVSGRWMRGYVRMWMSVWMRIKIIVTRMLTVSTIKENYKQTIFINCQKIDLKKKIFLGSFACQCKDGFIGDGNLCYGNFIKKISNSQSEYETVINKI